MRAKSARLLAILCLIVSGETIFSLPFHVVRFFRPTFLAAFDVSNAALGDAFAVYGLMAMLSYPLGGVLADRYPPRRLMTLSLLATAAGGLYFATLPGALGLALLFGYWGLTTILLFWAAMIRATRAWGGAAAQGRAFGLLDGGRGLAAAAFATIAVLLFERLAEAGAGSLTPTAGAAAIRQVILFYVGVTVAAAVGCWFLPGAEPAGDGNARSARGGMRAVLGTPAIWLNAVVVATAYCGYKGLDYYALYVFEALGASEVSAAKFAAASAWLRPLAAVGAGLLADRIGAARVVGWLFALLAASYGLLAGFAPTPALLALVYANLLLSVAGVYAVRGVYFALVEEASVPDRLTGRAVGLISLVGFTPDLFFAPLAGRLLDRTPGVAGHQQLFLLLAAIAVAGALATWGLRRRLGRPARPRAPASPPAS